jgi:hypothetical protein
MGPAHLRLTTNAGGMAIPTPSEADFTGVQAGSGELIVRYNFAADPDQISINDGSATTAVRRASSATAANDASALPTITVADFKGIRPSTLALSGDGGDIVIDLTWSSWTATGAVGNGTVGVESCVPDARKARVTPPRRPSTSRTHKGASSRSSNRTPRANSR